MINKIKNKVFITTTATLSCAGKNSDELFYNTCNANTGIASNTEYSYNISPSIGKIVSKNTFDKNITLQCQNILDNSSLKNFEDTILIIGSSVGGMNNTENSYFQNNTYKDIDTSKHNINTIANVIKQKFKFYDDISFSTACTSSANALGYAYEVLKKGIYKNALVVGVDSLSKTTVNGFSSLGVLSSKPCQPFDKNREGMNVSEAIACLLIETESNENSVEICGVGYSSDAYHMTQPHPIGSKNAMQNALNSAHIRFDEVNYINAHGTGTIANDNAEAQSISEVFPNQPYVSSTKSITGHTLGAAGAIEAIISSKIIQNQTVPKNAFLTNPENNTLNFSQETIKTKVNYVLSNSFAFGGNNCSLIFGKIK